MTEAAVGAGISTVLLLSALYLVQGRGSEAAAQAACCRLPWRSSTGVRSSTARSACPRSRIRRRAIHQHVAPRYLEGACAETGVPNIVTAVLASYRGYDTLGETTVVFTAGIGVIALLRRGARATGRRAR